MPAYDPNDSTRLISRIRKMLALANDAGATEGERDTALRMAHALLAKHNLDLATITATDATPTSAAIEPRTDTAVQFGGWPWARYVASSIAELFFCTYVCSAGRTRRTWNHYFIGRASNATTASLVAEFVVTSIYREAARRKRAEDEGNAFLRSFAWGAAFAIRQRVDALKRQPEPIPDATPGTALVLANLYDTEARANAQYVAKRWPVLKTARQGKSLGHRDALEQGRSYGASVSLNAQVR